MNFIEYDQEGYQTLEHPEKNKILDNKTMKLAFFFEGSKVINLVNTLKVKLIQSVFIKLLIFVVAITAL